MNQTLPPPALQPNYRSRHGVRSFATLRNITALVLREMSTRYGRTPGGYIWAILEPLAAIIFISIGFSLVLRSPSLGSSFLLFYASGYLPFNLYGILSGSIAHALNFSKPLLKYPVVIWLDAVLARFILNSLTSILITAILIIGITAAIDYRSTLDLGPMVQATALAMLLGLGVGTLNCAIMGLFPVWNITWSILTRPLFLASAILYIFEDLPPLAQNILWYNPLTHITGLMRTGLYPTYNPSYISPVFVLMISLALLAMGLLLMRRYNRVILNR